jgi:hypothetical protein
MTYSHQTFAYKNSSLTHKRMQSLWSCGWSATPYKCGDGQMIRSSTARRLALILRTTARYIPTEWLLRPDFITWPPTRRRDVLWLLAQTFNFQLNQTGDPTLFGYIQHIRAKKRLLYTQARRSALVANFLCVVEEDWMANESYSVKSKRYKLCNSLKLAMLWIV